MEPPRRKIAQAFHQHVDLIEAFVLREFIEKFENCSFGRRYRQRPISLAPGQCAQAGILKRPLSLLIRSTIRNERREANIFQVGPEKGRAVVIRELFLER